MKTFALCSKSTGKSNFAVVSGGTIGEATERARTGSLPVTPCMELPGEPSISAISVSLERDWFVIGMEVDMFGRKCLCCVTRDQNYRVCNGVGRLQLSKRRGSQWRFLAIVILEI